MAKDIVQINWEQKLMDALQPDSYIIVSDLGSDRWRDSIFPPGLSYVLNMFTLHYFVPKIWLSTVLS